MYCAYVFLSFPFDISSAGQWRIADEPLCKVAGVQAAGRVGGCVVPTDSFGPRINPKGRNASYAFGAARCVYYEAAEELFVKF